MANYRTKIIFAFILFTAFVTPSVVSASVLPTIRQNLDESVNRLIEARNNDDTNILSEQNSEQNQNNVVHRKRVISDVLALSLQEIISVRNRLNSINIEKESPCLLYTSPSPRDA